MTKAEKLAYLEASLQTETALNTTITRLEGRLGSSTLTLSEERLIKANLADLVADRAKVRAGIDTYLEGELNFRAPTPQEVATIKQIAQDIAAMVGNAMVSQTIITAATDIAAAYAGLSNPA